jgi:hypothetical protein
MIKWVLIALGAAGLVGMAVKEFPSLVRVLKILRMGSAPQGPAWHQRAS